MADDSDGSRGRLRSSTSKPDLKKQVLDLITNDKSLLDKIVETVASVIVDKVIGDDNFISAISNKLSTSLAENLWEQNQRLKEDLARTREALADVKTKHENFVKKTEISIDHVSQYGRRNCLLVHGLQERSSEDTDELVLEIFNTKLPLVHITRPDLDRSHRLGKKNSNSTKPRPIIVKFVAYNTRSLVFRKKKALKGSGVSISESLTPYRQNLYTRLQKHPFVKAAWTLDGRIICLLDDDSKVSIENELQVAEKFPSHFEFDLPVTAAQLTTTQEDS